MSQVKTRGLKVKNKVIFKKIEKVLGFVWKNKYSNFYSLKYAKEKINPESIKSWEDFQKIPFLTKAEIINSDPFDRFFLPWKEFGTVSVSSGTTSSPDSLSVVFKQQGQINFHRRSVLNSSIKSGTKSCMRLLSPVQATRHFFEYYTMIEKQNRKIISIIGDIHNLPLSAKIAARLKTDLLITSPTILYFFLPYLKKEYDLDNIKRISLFGEFCPKQKALLFKKQFKKAEFTFTYGLSELQGGSVGFDCKFLDSLITNYFHPSDQYYYEAINSGGGNELVISNLYKNSFPLIRYKTGDLVELENFDCHCGAKQKIKVLGRVNYDTFKLHGSIIYAQLLDKALNTFQHYLSSPDWQLHIYEETKEGKIMPRFELRLVLKQNYLKQKMPVKTLIEKGVSKKLYLSAKNTLEDLVTNGFFLPLTVTFDTPFERSNSTKLRRIVPHLD